MDVWFQILPKQWYITLLNHGITWVSFELNKQKRVYYMISHYCGECIMWPHVIGIASSLSTFFWIRLACVLKNVIDMVKISLRFYYYVHPRISYYLPHDWQKKLTRVINNTAFYFIWQFCFIYVQIRHVTGLGEAFCNGPGTEFVCSPYHIFKFLVL